MPKRRFYPEANAVATQPLQRAVAEAANLPERDQDALAALVMEELEAQKKWDDGFAISQDALAQMAAQALTEHLKAQTRPLDVDAL